MFICPSAQGSVKQYVATPSEPIVILPLEHGHGQTDSRAQAQRLSAIHHKVTWSILIGCIYKESNAYLV